MGSVSSLLSKPICTLFVESATQHRAITLRSPYFSLLTVSSLSLQSGLHMQGAQGCVPCHCNSFGSKSFDCDESGQCRCQPGVTGQKCDRCAPGHFSFQEGGCTCKNSPPNLEPLIEDRVSASVIQSRSTRAFRCLFVQTI